MIQASSRIRWRVGVVLTAAAIAPASVPTVAGASVVAKNKKKNKGTIGYVVAGDRNDGGFYQGQVESVTKTGKKLGYKVIVVDKVNPGAAQEAFQNLCRQAPKLIIGGGSELTDGFVPVAESPECSKISWVLVAGFRRRARATRPSARTRTRRTTWAASPRVSSCSRTAGARRVSLADPICPSCGRWRPT